MISKYKRKIIINYLLLDSSFGTQFAIHITDHLADKGFNFIFFIKGVFQGWIVDGFFNLFGQKHLNDGILVNDLFFLWFEKLLKSGVLAFDDVSLEDLVLEFEAGAGLLDMRGMELVGMEGLG